jgi:hypothetical protein
VAVIIHVEAIVYIVLPDSWMTIDTVGGMVGYAASVFFGVNRSWGSVIWRNHPKVVFFVVDGGVVYFDGHLNVMVRRIMIGGRWARRWRSRPMHHGVGVGGYLVFILEGVTDRQVFVEFRFWNCVGVTL